MQGNGRFKNLKEYINNNHSEIGKIKYDLEEEKKLSVDFKKKFDTLPKTMINMIDSAVRRSNEYTELKQKDIEKNNLAKQYEIPLVRIPYWERDNLTLQILFDNKYLI